MNRVPRALGKRALICASLAALAPAGATLLSGRTAQGAPSGAPLASSLRQFRPEGTQDRVSPLTIPALRQRSYAGGRIETVRSLGGAEGYTRSLIAYPSDGLRITGVMTVPRGQGPFPVLLLNHGDIPVRRYWSGAGTGEAAAFLTRAGYLTLASDYRGYAGSEHRDDDPSIALHHPPEYAIDVLNLLASVSTLPQADPSRIGIWGHSLGGETALRVIEADRRRQIKAAVLWAPSSALVNENNRAYTPQETPPVPGPLNHLLSPLNYVSMVACPVQIHQGSADSEVDPTWAIDIRDALQRAGKHVEFHWYPGEAHNFRAGGWGDISRRTTTFFNHFVKGRGQG